MPIIHAGKDMGSMAESMENSAVRAFGEEVWHQHQEVVARFWDAIAVFFSQVEVTGFKVYQDGLVADGLEGWRIVEESAKQGSVNYRVVAGLLSRGAVLVKTEDLSLIKKEYEHIGDLSRAKSPWQREAAAIKYRLARGSLLHQRDGFITRTIVQTLHEGETGILFIGAHHDVLSKLPANIQIVPVKDLGRIREYHRLLTAPRGKMHCQHISLLADYLVQPVPLCGTGPAGSLPQQNRAITG